MPRASRASPEECTLLEEPARLGLAVPWDVGGVQLQEPAEVGKTYKSFSHPVLKTEENAVQTPGAFWMSA